VAVGGRRRKWQLDAGLSTLDAFWIRSFLIEGGSFGDALAPDGGERLPVAAEVLQELFLACGIHHLTKAGDHGIIDMVRCKMWSA